MSWGKSRVQQNLGDVRKHLLASGLAADDAEAAGLAADFKPRVAFSRALRQMADERVIRRVEETPDTLFFQLTREEKGSAIFSYTYETILSLNKENGIIASVDSPALEEVARREFQRALLIRGSSDLSLLIKKLIQREGDLVPLADAGGVYFFPAAGGKADAPFLDKLNAFCSAVAGRLNRLPIPKGSGGDDTVGALMEQHLKGLVSSYHDHVLKFDESTREKTLDTWTVKVQELKLKIEGYAVMLKDRQAALLSGLDRVNEELVRRVTASAQLQEAGAA